MPDSYVYFIREKSEGHIKIGTSKDVERRLSALQTSFPRELELLCSVEGDCRLERKLHRQFADHRVSGEWFLPAEDILDYVRRCAPAKKPAAEFSSVEEIMANPVSRQLVAELTAEFSFYLWEHYGRRYVPPLCLDDPQEEKIFCDFIMVAGAKRGLVPQGVAP